MLEVIEVSQKHTEMLKHHKAHRSFFSKSTNATDNTVTHTNQTYPAILNTKGIIKNPNTENHKTKYLGKNRAESSHKNRGCRKHMVIEIIYRNDI